MFDWSAHQISNDTLRDLFKNGFTSRSAIAQIRESDLRYLRKHTNISPGQIVLLRGVIENISKEKKGVKVAETQTTWSEQEIYSADNASGNLENVSSENEHISNGANIPVILSNEGTLNVNLLDIEREPDPRLPKQTQNASESIPVSNQTPEMSVTLSTEQTTGAERSQIVNEPSNSTTRTQTNSLSTFSPNEIDIAGVLSQLFSNRIIPSDQNNVASQQSFTTISAHAAEGNSGLNERSGLELAHVNAANEAQRWNLIFPGKNEYAYYLKMPWTCIIICDVWHFVSVKFIIWIESKLGPLYPRIKVQNALIGIN